MQFALSENKPLQVQKLYNLNFQQIWIKGIFIFTLSWFAVYLNVPTPLRLVVVAFILLSQLSSYYNAVTFLLLVLFIPFFKNLDGLNISGLKLPRVIFLPFLYYSLLAPKRRRLKIDGLTLTLVLISLASIVLTSELRKILQEIPAIEGTEGSTGIKNTISRLLDTYIVLSFLYFTFTRLTLRQLSNLLKLLILFALLEACAINFLVSQDIQSVIGDQFDKFYLWRNPFFGHKNDWGMMLMFIVLLAYLQSQVNLKERLFYRIVIVVTIVAVAFSLSRQAYFSLLCGFILIFFFQQKFKPVLYLIILLAILSIVQPTFLFDRIDSLMNVNSLNEFQGLSRKVGTLAIDQFKSNLTFLPQMFFTEWEYNWSEGFWNGLLHQQGIPGLLFHILLYAFLISRYFYFFNFNYNPLKALALFGIVSSIIIFVSNFNRRSTHLMHYDGNIDQIGFISLFILLYTNLIYYSLRNKDPKIADLS